MTLYKLRKPFLTPLYWRPYNEWLWVANVSITESYSAPSEYVTLGYPLDSYNTTTTEIGQAYVDNEPYTAVPSLASCYAIEKSWYYNIGAQELYVHIAHEKRADASEFDTLQVNGYNDGSAYFYDDNNIGYAPLGQVSFNLTDKLDRIKFSRMSFVPNTVVFDNTWGDFDYVFTSPVPGADVNVLFLSEKDRIAGKKGLTPIYTGYVKSQKVTSKIYTIKLGDKREQLNGKYPNTFFDATTYPNMEEKYIGDLIPEGYGELSGVPAFCTNGELASGDVTYKYATDGTVLTTVYVKEDDVWTAVTPLTSSATNCTFTLASADGRASSGRYLPAKVDCTLREEKNPLDIISDIITRYLGFPFNTDYFNIAEWGEERALLYDIGYYISKRQEFFKHIEALQNASNLNFAFRIDANGKYSAKVDDITRTVCCDLDYIDNMNDSRNVSTDFEQYATSVNIGYNVDHESEDYSEVTIDTYKEETLDTYRFEQELDFETMLNSLAHATERGDNVLKDYKKARDKHTIIIDGIVPQPLLDVYTFDSSIYIRLEKIQEYAGNIKLKISEYSLDFKNEQTTLTGYDISDIISKGTEVYSQGDMYGDGMYGTYDDAYGPTIIYQPEAG